MIYLIIGAIGFAIFIYFITESIAETFFGSLIGLFIGMIIWLSIGGIIGEFLPTKEIIETKPLYALTDTTSTYGEKFLFSGYIDEKLTYRYITETERGKHIEEIDTKNVYVNEGDYQPHLKISKKELAKDWYFLFANDLAIDETTYYEFYVPENTLIHNYQIDLE